MRRKKFSAHQETHPPVKIRFANRHSLFASRRRFVGAPLGAKICSGLTLLLHYGSDWWMAISGWCQRPT